MSDSRVYLEYLSSTESFDEWKRKINLIIDALSDLYTTEMSTSESNVAGNLYIMRPVLAGITINEKGTVASSASLPSTGNESGDTYKTMDGGVEKRYVWNGVAWRLLQ